MLKLTDSRNAALAKWEVIAHLKPSAFGLYVKMQLDLSRGRQVTLQEVLNDVFAVKASAALHGRAGQILTAGSIAWPSSLSMRRCSIGS